MKNVVTAIALASLAAPSISTTAPTWGWDDNFYSNVVRDIKSTSHSYGGTIAQTTDVAFERLAQRQQVMTKGERVKLELHSYLELPMGWDGDSGMPADEALVKNAITFLEALPVGLPIPNVMLSQNGEPSFYWDTEKGYADISFDSSDSASYYARKKEAGDEFFMDDVKLSLDESTEALRSIKEYIA